MFKAMTNLLNNLKIGQRLTLGFGILVVLILFFGIVQFIVASVQDATERIVLEAEEEAATYLNLSLQLAEAQRAEKDFLARWRSDGFDAAYNSYYLLNQAHLQTLRDLIAGQQLEGHEHNRTQLTQIEEAISAYDTLFTSVVLNYQKRGFKDTGLEGEFRTAVQELETSTVFQTNPELLITLLQMRRNEKDYFLRGEQQYIDNTRSANANLQNQIRGLNLPEVSESELLALAAAYLSKFDEVVTLEAEINTQTGEYLSAIGAIEQIPDELIADAIDERDTVLANLQTVRQFAQIVNFSVLGVAVVIGLWLAAVIRRSITEPLRELTSAATQLGQGDFSQRATVRTHDEAGLLAQAFNQMAQGIQDAQQRVEARTQDLATTIEVGRLATSIYGQEELLPRVVEFIGTRFALYYTQIYLVDEGQRYATLTAATGKVGQQLLQQRHRLDLGQTSLVGTAVQTRQSVLVTNTETSSIHKKNPLLPDTRSELAIPLIVGDDILGVLDMQAERPGTFNQENLPVYEAMTAQLAAVMQGARAYDAAQAATETAESIIRRLTGDQWIPYLGQLAQGKRVGYQYDLETPTSLDVEALFQNGERALQQAVMIRGQQIGSIVLKDETRPTWTEEEKALVEGVAERVALTLEQFRAFDQIKQSELLTEKRASELETVAMVSAATTSILDVEELLQSVVDLTNDSFNLYHTHIYLLDDAKENLVLAAGAGEPGRIMKERGHRIPLNHEHSLVARAARTLQPVISNDVTADPDFLPNPLLPETKSEVAISMIVAGEVIGVLDVQGNVTNRFREEDVRIKTTLADQIAVAVQNARTFAEIQAHADRLREVDRLKSQFLANMSHELRTPLNSIIGYSEVLLDGVDGDLTEDAAEDVQAIHDSGKHLLSIINEILDLAKIEAGQMQLDRKPVKLSDFVQEIVKAGQILVKDKPVVLNWMEDSPIEAEVMADPIRLRQIMWNLVSNAVKFTEEGGVTVAYGMYSDQEVYLKVTDTGIGINEEGMSVIFERFRQADGSSTRRAGGTGLGLTITRELVQMHGGEIHVESEVGVGSTFWFTLPVKRTEPAQS